MDDLSHDTITLPLKEENLELGSIFYASILSELLSIIIAAIIKTPTIVNFLCEKIMTKIIKLTMHQIDGYHFAMSPKFGDLQPSNSHHTFPVANPFARTLSS